MAKRLTQKQETFCLKYFELGNATEAALIAGYSKKNAVKIASENLTKLDIQNRIDELRKKAEDAAISTVQERQKILTQIERAVVADFVDKYGNLDISEKEKLNTAAVAEIKTERTLVGLKTTLKLRDPIGAIAEHNKMDKIYSENPTPTIQTVQNFIFVLPDGVRLTPRQLVSGQLNAENPP